MFVTSQDELSFFSGGHGKRPQNNRYDVCRSSGADNVREWSFVCSLLVRSYCYFDEIALAGPHARVGHRDDGADDHGGRNADA